MSNLAATRTIDNAAPSAGIRVAGQLLVALFLGTVILYGAGFLNMGAAHNAAHDTRHSQGFPCH